MADVCYYRVCERARKLHSMMSVLPNGGVSSHHIAAAPLSAALDDVSATEWRGEFSQGQEGHLRCTR